MSSWHPYFRRRRPRPTLDERSFQSDGKFVDFTWVPPPEHGHPDPVAEVIARFDDHAAAAVVAAVGIDALDVDAEDPKDRGKPARIRRRPPITWIAVPGGGLSYPKEPWSHDQDLSEFKRYAGARKALHLLLSKCLPGDGLPGLLPRHRSDTDLRALVSSTITDTTWLLRDARGSTRGHRRPDRQARPRATTT